MMAKPKGKEWLESEMLKLQLQEVDIVVSLLESHEEKQLGLNEEERFCEKYDIHFLRFPIPDGSVPDRLDSFVKFVSVLDKELKQDKRIAIHCKSGIGRASLICAAILLRNDENAKNVFELLSEKRTLKVPESPEQVTWILDREDSLK